MVKLVWHTGRTSIFFLSTRSLMPRYYAYKKGTSESNTWRLNLLRVLYDVEKSKHERQILHIWTSFLEHYLKTAIHPVPVIPRSFSSLRREARTREKRKREKKEEGIKVKRRQQLLTSQPERTKSKPSRFVPCLSSISARSNFKNCSKFLFLSAKKQKKKKRIAQQSTLNNNVDSLGSITHENKLEVELYTDIEATRLDRTRTEKRAFDGYLALFGEARRVSSL